MCVPRATHVDEAQRKLIRIIGAGMAGMEPLIKQGAREAHGENTSVKVIDGARAGVEVLAGLVRLKY